MIVKTNFLSHLHELKQRVIYSLVFFILCFAISYFYAEDVYRFLLAPLADGWGNTQKHMIYTNLTEIFFSYLSLAYYMALFLAIPFFACQLYIFIAPGLYKNEKKAFLPFLIFSPILFALGIFFVYYVIFPLAWKFFLGFEAHKMGDMPIKLEAKISEYLGLVINMMFAFGIAFQMPIILALLAKLGIINDRYLKEKRRFAIVLIFILAAVLTPPDAVSQIGLAIPMLILYELSILACKKISKGKKNA